MLGHRVEASEIELPAVWDVEKVGEGDVLDKQTMTLVNCILAPTNGEEQNEQRGTTAKRSKVQKSSHLASEILLLSENKVIDSELSVKHLQLLLRHSRVWREFLHSAHPKNARQLPIKLGDADKETHGLKICS